MRARSRSRTKRAMRGPRSEENSQWNTRTTRFPWHAGMMAVFNRKSSIWSSWCRFNAHWKETQQRVNAAFPHTHSTPKGLKKIIGLQSLRSSIAILGQLASMPDWNSIKHTRYLDVASLKLVWVPTVNDNQALHQVIKSPIECCYHLKCMQKTHVSKQLRDRSQEVST